MRCFSTVCFLGFFIFDIFDILFHIFTSNNNVFIFLNLEFLSLWCSALGLCLHMHISCSNNRMFLWNDVLIKKLVIKWLPRCKKKMICNTTRLFVKTFVLYWKRSVFYCNKEISIKLQPYKFFLQFGVFFFSHLYLLNVF